MAFEDASIGKPFLTSEPAEFEDAHHETEADDTMTPEEPTAESYLRITSAVDLIKKSRDRTALEEYMTAYYSVIPPKKPYTWKFDYLDSFESCADIDFDMFVTLDLNRVACALGMGFFSLGSAATMPLGHIFFHKFNWSQEQREQYQSMSRAGHEALATRWAFDKSFAAGKATVGLTLLYQGNDPRERPNPLGVHGRQIHVLPKARAILYLQAQGPERRILRPHLLLRLALERYPGLVAEATQMERSNSVLDPGHKLYKRFTLDGDDAVQLATLERLERDFRCDDYAHVVKLLHFWS